MSAPLFTNDVQFLQRLLRAEGIYRAEPTGMWDAVTEEAFGAFDARSRAIQDELGSFDLRSERAIQSLSLRAQCEARLSLRRLVDKNIRARIISGTRTYCEQNALYRQGRFGNAGPVVTKARGGYGNHNFGIAWDIAIFTATGGYLSDRPTYEHAAPTAMADALEWGGEWKSFSDPPHYQLPEGDVQPRPAHAVRSAAGGYAVRLARPLPQSSRRTPCSRLRASRCR
jgi:peptidoglycan LD-endopeptidase CwlK